MSDIYKTVVSITDTDVKILQARVRRGEAVPFYFFVRDLDHSSPESLQAALREGLPASLTRIGHVVLLVSRREVLMRPVRLPSHSASEIQRMVDLQISHLTPFAREDLVICHTVTAKEPDGYSRVLIQAAPKGIVLSQISLLTARKVPCHQVVLSSFGVGAWSRRNLLSPRDAADHVVALLDVDRRGSELCFMRGGMLLFSRYLAFGHEDENPETRAAFLAQIFLTVKACRREGWGGSVARFIIISEADLAWMKERLQDPEISPAVEQVSVRQRVLERLKKNHGGLIPGSVSWTALLGGLSNGLSQETNLIPREIIQIKSSALKRREGIRFVIALLGMMGVLWAALNLENFQKERRLSRLQAVVQEQQVSVKRAQENIEAVEALQDKLHSRIVLVDILRGLYEQVPEPVSLRSLQLDPKGTMIVSGLGVSRSAVNQFHNNLVSSLMFQKVSLEYATERKQYKEEYVEFKIFMPVIP